MSEASGDKDSSSSVASPDTAVTSTSAGETASRLSAAGLPKLGSSPTRRGGEAEVSSTSTSGEEANQWNFTDHIDDINALAGDKNPFIGMSEEDISQIESVLCTEEGKKILQQTTLDELASPLNSMEEDDDEAEEEDSENGLNGALKLEEDDFELDDQLLKEPLNLNFMGEPLNTFPAPNPALSESESKDGDDERDEVPRSEESELDDKSLAKLRSRPGTRRSTRIQDQEQRDMAEKIRKENLEKESNLLKDLRMDGSQSEDEDDDAEMDPTKQYNMRTKRPQREDGRIDYTKVQTGKMGKGQKDEDAEAGQLSNYESDGDELDDMPSIDPNMIEPMGAKVDPKKSVTTRSGGRGKKMEGKTAGAARGRGKRGAGGKKGGRGGKAGAAYAESESERDVSPAARGRGRGRARGAGRKAGVGRGKKKAAAEFVSEIIEPEVEKTPDEDSPAKDISDVPDDTGTPKKGKAKGKKAATKKASPKKKAGSAIKFAALEHVGDASEEQPMETDVSPPPTTEPANGKGEKAAQLEVEKMEESGDGYGESPEKEIKSDTGKIKAESDKEPSQDDVIKPEMDAGEVVPTKTRPEGSSELAHSSDSENELFEDEDDSDWGPEDDPEMLWCVCKKPYNNRFMIACDTCELWFHGSCMGITKKQGKEMARNKQSWFCAQCKEEKKSANNKTELVESEEMTETVLKEKPTEVTEKKSEVWTKRSEEQKELVSQLQEKLEALKKKRITSDVKAEATGAHPEGESSAPADVSSDVQEVKKEAVEEEASVEKVKKKKKKKRESKEVKKESLLPVSMKEKCTMCGQTARPGSVYCSDECIAKHADESLSLIEQDRSKMFGGSRPSGSQASQERIVVFERKTGKILTGPAAPTDSTLLLWLEKHPTFEVLRPGQQVGQSAAAFYAQKKEKERMDAAKLARQKEKERREKEMFREKREAEKKKREELREKQRIEAARKQRESKQVTYSGGLDPLRIGVRKSLRDNLNHRANSADDVMLSGAEIKKVALDIEEELFKLYGAVNSKYKTKYKALITGIKDEENKGLFRKILNAELKPAKLIRLSTEQIGSKELAKWKESRTEFELGDLDKDDSPPKGGKRTSDAYTSQASWIVDPQADVLSSIIIDSTASHGKHFFDLNCKICTGKLPEQGLTPPAKKAKVSFTSADEEKPEADAKSSDELVIDTGKSDEEQAPIKYGPEPDFVHHDPFCLGDGPPKTQAITATTTATTATTATTTSSQPPVVTTAPATFQPAPPPPSKPVVSTPAPIAPVPLSPAYKKPPHTLAAEPRKLEVKPHNPRLWRGSVFAPDVCKFNAAAIQVSGICDQLRTELPNTVNIMGRLPPENVFDYLSKVRSHTSNREIVTIAFEPDSADQKELYTELLTYLDTRNRCGVVGSCSRAVKDMYIVPLPRTKAPPPVLLPFDGPGLPVNRKGLILGVIVKQKSKRPPPPQEAAVPSKTWMYSERMDGEHPHKRARKDPNLDSAHIPKVIPMEVHKKMKQMKAAPPAPAPGVPMAKDPRSKGIAVSRDPRQRAHAPNQPPAAPTPQAPVTSTVSPTVPTSQAPGIADDSKKQLGKEGLLDQAQPQNALQAAILARAKAQIEAAKASKGVGAMSPMSLGSPGKEDSPPDMDAEDYSSSDNEDIDTMEINDPIVRAYSKRRRPAPRDEEEEEPYEPGDEEPYDPLKPDIPEAEKVKLSKPQQPPAVQAPATYAAPGISAAATPLHTPSIAASFTQIIQQASAGSMSVDVTAAMLATLAASSASRSIEEQRQLLQTLTDQVEEQKQILERQREEAMRKLEAEKAVSSAGSAAVFILPGLGDIPLPSGVSMEPPAPVEEEVIEIQEPDELETPMSPDADDTGSDTKTRAGSSTPPLIPIDYGKDAMATNVARNRLAQRIKKKELSAPPAKQQADSAQAVNDAKSSSDFEKGKNELDLLSALLSGRSFENLKNIVAKAQQVDPEVAKAELTKKGDTDLRPKNPAARVLDKAAGKKTRKSNTFADDEMEAAMNDPGGMTNVGKYFEQEQQKKMAKLREQIDADKTRRAAPAGGQEAPSTDAKPDTSSSSNPFGIELTSGVTGDVDDRQGQPPPGGSSQPAFSGPLPPGMSLPVTSQASNKTDVSSDPVQWPLDETNLPNIPGLGDVQKIPMPLFPMDKPTDVPGRKPTPETKQSDDKDKSKDQKDDSKRSRSDSKKEPEVRRSSSRLSSSRDKKKGDDKEDGEVSDEKSEAGKRRRSRSRDRRRSRRSRSRDKDKDTDSKSSKDAGRRSSRRSRSRDKRKRRSKSRSRSRDRRAARGRFGRGGRGGRLPFGRFGPGGIGRVPSPKRSRSRSPRRKDRGGDKKKDDKDGKRGRNDADKRDKDISRNDPALNKPENNPNLESNLGEALASEGAGEIDVVPSAPFITQTFDYGHGVGDATSRPPRISRFSDIDERSEPVTVPPMAPPIQPPLPPPGFEGPEFSEFPEHGDGRPFPEHGDGRPFPEHGDGRPFPPPRRGGRGGRGRGAPGEGLGPMGGPPMPPPGGRPSLLGDYRGPPGDMHADVPEFPPEEDFPRFEEGPRRGRGRGPPPSPPRRSRFGAEDEHEDFARPPMRGGRGGFPDRGRPFDRRRPPGREFDDDRERGPRRRPGRWSEDRDKERMDRWEGDYPPEHRDRPHREPPGPDGPGYREGSGPPPPPHGPRGPPMSGLKGAGPVGLGPHAGASGGPPKDSLLGLHPSEKLQDSGAGPAGDTGDKSKPSTQERLTKQLGSGRSNSPSGDSGCRDSPRATASDSDRPPEGHTPVFPPMVDPSGARPGAPSDREAEHGSDSSERPPRRDDPAVRGRPMGRGRGGPLHREPPPEDYERGPPPPMGREREPWPEEDWGPPHDGPPRGRGRLPRGRGRGRFDPDWPPRGQPPRRGGFDGRPPRDDHPPPLPRPPHGPPLDRPPGPPPPEGFDYPPDRDDRGGRRGAPRGRGRFHDDRDPEHFGPGRDWEEFGPPPRGPPPEGGWPRPPPGGMDPEGFRREGPMRGRGRDGPPPRGREPPPRGRGGRGRFEPGPGDEHFHREDRERPPDFYDRHPEDRFGPDDGPRRGRPADGPPRGRGIPRGRFDRRDPEGRPPVFDDERRPPGPDEGWGEDGPPMRRPGPPPDWRGRGTRGGRFSPPRERRPPPGMEEEWFDEGPPDMAMRGRGRGRGWDRGRGRGRAMPRGGPP